MHRVRFSKTGFHVSPSCGSSFCRIPLPGAPQEETRMVFKFIVDTSPTFLYMQKKLFTPVLSPLFNKRALLPLSFSVLAAALVSCGGGGNSSSGDRLPEGSRLVLISNQSYNSPDRGDQQHSFVLHVQGSGSDLCFVWLNNSSNQVGSPASAPVAVIYRRNGKEATFSMTAEFTQSQIVLPGPVIEYTALTATISANITYPNDHPSNYGQEDGTCVYSASFEGTIDSEYPTRVNFTDIPDGRVMFYPAG